MRTGSRKSSSKSKGTRGASTSKRSKNDNSNEKSGKNGISKNNSQQNNYDASSILFPDYNKNSLEYRQITLISSWTKKYQRNEYGDDKSGGWKFLVGIGDKKDSKKKGNSQTPMQEIWNKIKERKIRNLNKSMNLIKSKILLSCWVPTFL